MNGLLLTVQLNILKMQLCFYLSLFLIDLKLYKLTYLSWKPSCDGWAEEYSSEDPEGKIKGQLAMEFHCGCGLNFDTAMQVKRNLSPLYMV